MAVLQGRLSVALWCMLAAGSTGCSRAAAAETAAAAAAGTVARVVQSEVGHLVVVSIWWMAKSAFWLPVRTLVNTAL
jgi:hypothetical protein